MQAAQREVGVLAAAAPVAEMPSKRGFIGTFWPIIAMFGVVGLLLAAATAAPALAFRWPGVAVPLIRGREDQLTIGISIAALCAFLWWASSA